MRFCDLFISYKIGLKGIKSTIPFTKLPFYRKIAVALIFTFSLISAFLLIIKYYKIAFTIMSATILLLIIFLIIDSTKRNLEKMLKQHYSPYSQKRMRMVIQVLEKYKIDVKNMDLIDMLISEAKAAQIQCDYLTPLKKSIKVLGAIIIPIVAYAAQKIGEDTPQGDILALAIQLIIIILLIFSIIFAFATIVKDVLYIEYNQYNNFISDLHQIKIFYSMNDKMSYLPNDI